MMEPTLALETCENALRHLLAHVFRESLGEQWLREISNSEQRKKWAQRFAEEVKARPGVAGLPDNMGLTYSDFSDLVAIAAKRWKDLDGSLGARDETLPLLRRLDQLRNSIAHNRRLVPFEAELIAGIAGQIRNQVTTYLSSKDPSGDYYPRIESITDSFGNAFTPATISAAEAHQGFVTVELDVQVGDQVTFACVGTDPQGRELIWELVHANIGYSPPNIARGSEATLVWDVDHSHARLQPCAVIQMTADGGDYHRFTRFDAQVDWRYREVKPPPRVSRQRA